MKGTCVFSLGTDGLEYLGIPGKRPTQLYDGFTVFSKYGDLFASHESIRTVYFVVLKPGGANIKQLSEHEQQREITGLLNTLEMDDFSLFRAGDDIAAFVCWSYSKNDQVKIIDMLGTSKRWRISLFDRTIVTPENLPKEAILKQLRASGSGINIQHLPNRTSGEILEVNNKP
jgi:hypothetical protein